VDPVSQLQALRYALDQAAIVAMTDVSGRITFANDKFCAISQFSREELIGQDHRIVNSGLHSKEFMRNLWQTIARGQVWHGEIRNKAKDGSFYWVDTTVVPFLDDGGKPYQYIAIRHDITERKLGEERLRHQEALARVGQLAAMVAHEVKNPLAGIKAALQVLIARRPPGDPDITVMRDIIDRSDALNELISDLLVFSRPKPPQFHAIQLRAVVSESVGLMKKDPLAAAVGTEIEGADIGLFADGSMLRAVFSNLLMNAAQAMHGSGMVHIHLDREDGQARVRIRDTGPGVPQAIRDKIFEAFFTTKARGGGLGLPIARRSVELHGGTLSLDSAPEGGTVATVLLPLRTAAHQPESA
jgi:PAS domain S-box-containing protein